MDYTVIQEQIDRLSDAMIAKGLRNPRVQFQLDSHKHPSLFVKWEKPKKASWESDIYEWFNGGTIGEMLAKAAAFIEAMPSSAETKFNEFVGELGRVIDLGKENGIEVEYLNPLLATMKTLSENALTDQRAA